MRRWVSVLIVGLFVACGGGRSPSAADDQRTADKAILQASDLSSDFSADSSSSSSSSSSEEDAASSAANACFQQATGTDPEAVEKSRTAQAKSKFKKGKGLDSVSLDAEVEIVKDGKVFADQLAAFDNPAVIDCLETAFEQQAAGESGATISGIQGSFVRLDGVGEGGGTVKITATVTVQGISLPVGVNINFAKKGRVGVTTTVTAIGGEPNNEVAVNALKTMLGRA